MSAGAGDADPRAVRRDRYLGGRPFSDTPEDQALFFGRSAEVDALFSRILSGHLLVLFGKSGLGKTSLLRAGVFPRLREHANLPFEVRAGQAGARRDAHEPRAPGSSFLDMIAAAAADVAKRDPSLDYTPGEGETVWEFFKTAMFWRGDELQTPILVLDQFEEIFTLLDAPQRHEIAEAIGAACGPLPPSVRERRARTDLAPLSDEPPRLKFVISLREEYFGTLEQLSKDIRHIFLDRFQLLPLSDSQARNAVVMPASLRAFDLKSGAAGAFSVRPFTYREDALADMLAVLGGKAGTVEPFQLQVVCRHVEQKVAAIQAASTRDVIVTPKEIGGQTGVQKVIESYYLEQIGRLPRRQERLARTLCEEGLLTDSGYRLMLEESQIEKDYGLDAAVLDDLVNSRLLRREQRLDSQFYELSHDSLAKAILAVRPRLRLPRRYKYLAGAIVAIAIAGLVFGVAQWRSMKQTQAALTQASNALAVVSFLAGDDLQDELRRAARVDALVGVQRSLVAYFESMPGPAADASAVRDHALAYRNLGELMYESGRIGDARKHFADAERIFAAAAGRPDRHADMDRARALNWNRMSWIAVDQGHLTEAHDLARRSEEALASLVDRRAGDAAVKASFGEVALDAGRILFLQGRFPNALASTDKAVSALQDALTTRPDQRRWRTLLLSALEKKAQILEAMGQNQTARQILDEAGRVAEERRGQGDARGIYSLFMVRRRVASLVGPADREKFVERSMRWMVPRLEALSAADPSNARSARDAAVVNGILASELAAAAGDKNDWQGRYQRAATGLEELAARDPSNAAVKAELSSVKLRWARALAERDPDRARALRREGLQIASALVELDRTNMVWSLTLADALSKPIETDPASQAEQRERALAIIAELRGRNALPHWGELGAGLSRHLVGIIP